MKRRPNETQELYRDRRKKLQSAIKQYLKGRPYVPDNKIKRVFPASELF